MSKEGKHHYIPVFYLKQWAGLDSQICEYKQRYHGILTKRVHPDATGYIHGLNTVPGLPPEEAQYIEHEYLQKLDHKASLALKLLLQLASLRSDDATRTVAWASFLYSLTLRSPESLERMQQHYDSFRAEMAAKRPEDRSFVDEDGNRRPLAIPKSETAAPEFLPTFLSSKLVVRGIARMRWAVKSVDGARHKLLTSDRPIIMTNGLAKPTDHLAIPISPTKLFFATNDERTHDSIVSMPRDLAVEVSNNKVSEQAIKYVYGVDDSQLRFVARRLGRRVPSTPLG